MLKSQLTFKAGRSIIQTDVVPLPEGACVCQSNDPVSVTVELQDPARLDYDLGGWSPRVPAIKNCD